MRGPNLAWVKGKRKDLFHYEVGGRFISDGPPLIKFSSSFNEETDHRASRSDSLEIYSKFKYRFGFRKLFELGIFFSKEIHRHKGVYTSLHLKVPIYKYTSLTAKTGIGSSFHNNYLYGVGATSGLANQQLSLTYAIPKLPWKGVILLQANHNWVLQKENQGGSLVRGKSKKVEILTRWIWTL